jgi:hypothetical protein
VTVAPLDAVPDPHAFTPLAPAPSLGEVLSSAVPVAAPAVGPVGNTSVAHPDPVDTPAGEAEPHEYALVAPVELHFTRGEGRVGVRAGTRTYGEFQRLASILLDDLRKARGW